MPSSDNLQNGMKRVALLIGCGVTLASCGGGGGQVEVLPATTYRANGPGDAWDYSVQIDFGRFGAYSGTLTESFSDDTYNGSPSIKKTSVFNLALKTGPSTITSYAEFSPSGQLLAETVNAVVQVVSSNTLSVPSPLAIGNSASGTLTFNSGLTIAETYKITGAQNVSTPNGVYSCWIINQTAKRSDGVSDKSISWVAPETGNFVMLKDTTDNGDGTGYTYIAKLTSIITPKQKNRAFHQPIDMVANAVRTLEMNRNF